MGVLSDYAAVLSANLRGALRGNWKKLGVSLWLVAVLPIWMLTDHLLLALDRVLFPRAHHHPVSDPIFVVGNPRSGTTRLHRLLALDDQNAPFTLADLFLPSVVQRVVFAPARWLDARLGSPFGRLFSKTTASMEDGYAKMHRMDWDEAEEDDGLLLLDFASTFLALAFPEVPELAKLVRFDQEFDRERADRVLGRYRSIVARHLWLAGPGKRHLSKNPSFSGKLEGLIRAFPDARFVCIVRSPVDTIGSLLSIVHYVWVQTGALQPGEQNPERLLEVAEYFWRHPAEVLKKLPTNRYAMVRYDDLITDPRGTVSRLYSRLELPVDEAFAAALEQQAVAQKTYQSRHHYDLTEWGLDPEDIAQRFAWVDDLYFAENT